MKTLYIERSTGECRNGAWVNELDAHGVTRIVVGTGPGSFAGIRSALAFAQGYSLGTGCEVLGLPSACAIAADAMASGCGTQVAVVGDARRGKIWIALFSGYRLVREIFQVEQDGLAQVVDAAYCVVSPDDGRIGTLLRTTFGTRYLGGRLPTAEGLQVFAERNPEMLVREPLPIYLNPAVRD